MPRKRTKRTIAKKILELLIEVGDMMPRPFETPYQHIRRTTGIPRRSYSQQVARLVRRGAVTIRGARRSRTIKLTPKGKLEVLFWKAKIADNRSWDGKWRIVMFDIPEDAKRVRDRLRALLRAAGFRSLQASVYISPHALNRSALEYLRESDFIRYIRILRVDEMDDDRHYVRVFGLKK